MSSIPDNDPHVAPVAPAEQTRTAASHATTTAPATLGLVDAVLDASPTVRTRSSSTLDEFLAAGTLGDAMKVWSRAAHVDPQQTKLRQVTRWLNRDIARLDALLSRQVNVILHHPRFQKLEASWRGLKYLVEQVQDSQSTRIRILDASWKTLVRDLDRAIEFDQNQLFKKIYSEEFGTSGGEPFSVLLGDYEIRPGPRPGSPMDDLDALQNISQVAAASFAPFIASADSSLLGLDSFGELERPLNLQAIFEQPEFLKWRKLRQTEDARFVGLTLPQILMRLPYEDRGTRVDGFRFQEKLTAGRAKDYLWGNAAYAFGAVLIRAFNQSGWLADIRGVRPDRDEGGLVTGLPTQSFNTDSLGVVTKCSTDVMVTDFQEKELSELGFIPLCHCKDSEYSAFYSNVSIQKPAVYDEQTATANARISAMLQYMLCVSRLSHYLKVLGREKVGSFTEASDCEHFLNEWLQQYITQDDEAPLDVKAKYPLREAQVEVREQPGKPGSYYCVVHLQPHYQLDDMTTGIILSTELAPASG